MEKEAERGKEHGLVDCTDRGGEVFEALAGRLRLEDRSFPLLLARPPRELTLIFSLVEAHLVHAQVL